MPISLSGRSVVFAFLISIIHNDAYVVRNLWVFLVTEIRIVLRAVVHITYGNIFRVTAHLWGEFTGHWWIPRTHKGQWRGAFMFSLICAWINVWVNNREPRALRRHRAHYDAMVMPIWDATKHRGHHYGIILNWEHCNIIINICIMGLWAGSISSLQVNSRRQFLNYWSYWSFKLHVIHVWIKHVLDRYNIIIFIKSTLMPDV